MLDAFVIVLKPWAYCCYSKNHAPVSLRRCDPKRAPITSKHAPVLFLWVGDLKLNGCPFLKKWALVSSREFFYSQTFMELGPNFLHPPSSHKDFGNQEREQSPSAGNHLQVLLEQLLDHLGPRQENGAHERLPVRPVNDMSEWEASFMRDLMRTNPPKFYGIGTGLEAKN